MSNVKTWVFALQTFPHGEVLLFGFFFVVFATFFVTFLLAVLATATTIATTVTCLFRASVQHVGVHGSTAAGCLKHGLAVRGTGPPTVAHGTNEGLAQIKTSRFHSGRFVHRD